MANLIDLTKKPEDKRDRIYDAYKEGVFDTKILKFEMNAEGTILYVNIELDDTFRTISLEPMSRIETKTDDGEVIITEIPSLDNFFKGINNQWKEDKSFSEILNSGKTFKIANKLSKKGNNNWGTFPEQLTQATKTSGTKSL